MPSDVDRLSDGLSICAVIAARNEFPYLQVLLPILREQNIDVAIVDNDSEDGSSELFRDELSPVVHVEHVPFEGVMDLPALLGAKARVIDGLDHDWVVHMDCDEVPEHRDPGKTLRDALTEAHTGGYNAVNFEEFVFLPDRGTETFTGNYHREFLSYYHFAPRENRLNRAWRPDNGLTNVGGAGHKLEGPVRLAPQNHILRHYPVLSQEHARRKYPERKFAERALRQGWHGNRVGITAEALSFPPEDDPRLRRLERFDSKDFDRSRPLIHHYWEWDDPGQVWAEVAELRGQLKRVRSKLKRLRREQSQSEELARELADMRARNSRLEQRNSRLEQMFTRLTRSRAFRMAQFLSRLRHPSSSGLSHERLIALSENVSRRTEEAP